MEKVLRIFTIKSPNEISSPRIMTQDAYPFCICDVPLPRCRTGFVYMLTPAGSLIVYFNQTLFLWTRIQDHDRGYKSIIRQPRYLLPFTLMA